MERKKIEAICLSLIVLLYIFIISHIKIISFLFFIIFIIIFFMIFKECLYEYKVEELIKKDDRQILDKTGKKIEEQKKEKRNKINYQYIIYKTNDNIKNIFKNILDLFYNNDAKIDNTFKIYKSKIIKTFSYSSGIIEKIVLLKDGRLALSSSSKSNEYIYSILICDMINYSIDIEIGNLNHRVFDLMQINNGNIIASLTWGFILVFKINSNSYELIQKIKAHDDACTVEKTIEIKDGRLISCSKDCTIKIWKYNNKKYILENQLRAKKRKKLRRKTRLESYLSDCSCLLGKSSEYDIYYRVDDILELKNNIIVSIPNGNGPIIFWNIKELQMVCKFKEFRWDCTNKLKKLSNKFFIIGGDKYIFLFSILNYKLINKI